MLTNILAIHIWSHCGSSFSTATTFINQTIGQKVECSPMVQETGFPSQVESYQRLKKWYLMLPCLTLSIIKVRIKGKVELSREMSSALLYP